MTLSLKRLLAALRAAAEPTRLRLLAICAEGELSVGEITEVIGQSQPRVSRHLKLLCDAGLLVRFRDQNWVFYRVPPKGEPAELAHRILQLLDTDDDLRAQDHRRTEAVKRRRARLASEYLTSLSERGETVERGAEETEINEAIRESLSGGPVGDLLDIGTGTGRILKLLGDRAELAVGIDISSEMLLIARTNLHAAGLDRCMVRPGDMYRLPFANESFDTVTMDQVLHEAEQPRAVIAEAVRMLRPGGQLLVVELPAGHRHLDRKSIRVLLDDAGLAPKLARSIPEDAPKAWIFVARMPGHADVAA